METLRAQSWEKTFRQMDVAHTAAEIAAAEEAMRAHLCQWSEDRERDPWHGWGATKGAARERKEQADVIGLTPEQFAKREELFRWAYWSGDFVSDPTVLIIYRKLAQQLEDWLKQFPQDEAVQGILTWRVAEIELTEQLLQFLAESDDATRTDAPALVAVH